MAGNEHTRYKISVDGTDFRIYQPAPFSKAWFSYKFRGPGLRYEVALSIATGEIVWTKGPFAPGIWNDIAIFNAFLRVMLEALKEGALADGGYNGVPCITVEAPLDGEPEYLKKMKQRVRSRQETVNRRLKQFNVLHRIFRHSRHLHIHCFNACVVLVQLSIQNGEPLFEANFQI